MNDKERLYHQEEIILALKPYLEAFSQNKVSNKGLVIYAKALSNLSLEEIHAAMIKILRTNKFFPTISEIISESDKIRDFLQENSAPTASEAWQEAMRNAKKNHVYKEWVYSHKAVKVAVERFGVMEFCLLQERDMNIARSQFMRIYEGVLEEEKARQQYKDALSCLPDAIVEKLKQLGKSLNNSKPYMFNTRRNAISKVI
ncbi:MAG: hypothetical protein IKN12_05610 [Selenomonadaceae bacterium]|nr:hypothetical protein [Selenomonadaceae bacterium]